MLKIYLYLQVLVYLAGISSTNNSNLTAIQSGDIVINLSEDLVIDGIGSNNRLTAIDNSAILVKEMLEI